MLLSFFISFQKKHIHSNKKKLIKEENPFESSDSDTVLFEKWRKKIKRKSQKDNDNVLR